MPDAQSAVSHFDVLIVGAGLSGIGAAHHLKANCPTQSFAILEGRDAIGGTWDLFRYPGIRSDSDMFTLGYSFRPWTEAKSIADGASILNYIRETAREDDTERQILFRHRVVSASWSSTDARWSIAVERGEARERVHFTCGFLFMCSGYYNYAAGYMPEFPGIDAFAGRVVHPQKWTEDIDYAGKRVLIIGSGATAVTLAPEMSKVAAQVTMLQRSPTYVVARPAEDPTASKLRQRLPARLAYKIIRWRNVLWGMYFYRLCKRDPARVKKLILGGVRHALGPDFDVDTHFTPRYNPWDQRMCLVPDGDLFAAIKQRRVDVVTGEIETFTRDGIRLRDGRHCDADLIVSATGLSLQVLGGLALEVDGVKVDPAKTLNYKGMMYSDVPNFASAFGYTNASWTLKCDLTCEYVCRLINYMDAKNLKQCTPRNRDPSLVGEPWVDFTSGYVQRSLAMMPKQGSKKPWRLHQNYARDLVSLKFGRLDDGVMQYS